MMRSFFSAAQNMTTKSSQGAFGQLPFVATMRRALWPSLPMAAGLLTLSVVVAPLAADEIDDLKAQVQ